MNGEPGPLSAGTNPEEKGPTRPFKTMAMAGLEQIGPQGPAAHRSSALRRWPQGLFLVFLWAASSGLGEAPASKNNKANRLYHQGKYGEALKLYRDAQLESPRSPEIQFNAGDALYQSDQKDPAIEAYTKALSLGIRDKGLEARTHYNLGNCFFKKDLFQEAVASYGRALRLKPDDRDSKFNMELAQERLKEQQQRQQRPPEQEKQDKGKDKEKKDNRGRQQEAGQDRKEDRQGQQNREDQQNREGQGEDRPRPGELSRQEADSILDAVQDQERDTQKKRRVSVAARRYTGEEW